MALTRPNPHRPRGRDATRRSKADACAPGRTSRRLASVTTTNSAMATTANSRDHALICLIRAWAKPNHHCASRKPASQPGRCAYSVTACSAVEGRWATTYHSPHLPCLSRFRLIVIHSEWGLLAQDSRCPSVRRRVLSAKRSVSSLCHTPAMQILVLFFTRITNATPTSLSKVNVTDCNRNQPGL